MLVNSDRLSGLNDLEDSLEFEFLSGDSSCFRRQPRTVLVTEPVDTVLDIEHTRISLALPLAESFTLTIGQISEGKE